MTAHSEYAVLFADSAAMSLAFAGVEKCLQSTQSSSNSRQRSLCALCRVLQCVCKHSLNASRIACNAKLVQRMTRCIYCIVGGFRDFEDSLSVSSVRLASSLCSISAVRTALASNSSYNKFLYRHCAAFLEASTTPKSSDSVQLRVPLLEMFDSLFCCEP